MEEIQPKIAVKSSSYKKQQGKKKVEGPKHLNCSHCKYETNNNNHLKRHMIQHENKFAHQCPICTFSARSGSRLSCHLTSHHNSTDFPIERHSTPGARKKLVYCSECDYKNESSYWLMRHMKKKHPSSVSFQNDADEIAYCLSQGWTLHRCTYCEYTTYSYASFKNHMGKHVGKFAHSCHLCNYSVKIKSALNVHLKNHHSSGRMNKRIHGDDEALAATSLNNKVDRSGKIPFDLRECSVILEDIGPFDVINKPTHSSSSRIEERFQSLRFRAEVMENKVRIADEELRHLSWKKNDVTEKIQEIAAQKERMENDLRVEESETAEKRNQLNKMEGELLSLQEEEEYLTEDLRIAEDSLLGAHQVLLALHLDLKELESH